MINKKNTITLVQISFWLNGTQKIMYIPPGMTTLELLNNKLSLTGTKSSCNEGDCGACTVVIGQKTGSEITYQAVNSCLYPAFRLHGKHLITVEGLAEKEELHPIQTAMLDEHSTQCGFCTPGFVMSMLGLFLNNINPNDEEILAALEGNLCRCTGYDSILKAAKKVKSRLKKGSELLPVNLKKVEVQFNECSPAFIFKEIENTEGWETRNCFIPQTLSELWDNIRSCKSTDTCKFISGGTDLMVLANIQHIHYTHLIDLSNLKELQKVKLDKSELNIGANVTMSQLMENNAVNEHFPILTEAFKQMASTQIRNSATLAGNIAHASPVADGATTLLAFDAGVILASSKAERKVKLKDFYKAYKKTELKTDEIIKSIAIPLPSEHKSYSGFIKSAKRKAVDISGVVSVIVIEYQDGKITRAVLSFGGVAPYPALAVKTMAFLKGKKIEEGWFEQAAEVAFNEFKPISDIRGHQSYRSILIKNHVLKHLADLFKEVHSVQKRSK